MGFTVFKRLATFNFMAPGKKTVRDTEKRFCIRQNPRDSIQYSRV